MIPFDATGRFTGYRRGSDSWMEYVCWFDGPHSVRFTINDGRVPGNSAGLPADEFWALFTTVPGFGLREIMWSKDVDKSNPLGLWINTKHEWPWRSTTRRTAARWDTFDEAALRLNELRADAEKRGKIEEKYAAGLKVEHLPPMMDCEVGEVTRYLESIGVTTLAATHRIMRGNLGDRSTSKAANIDNMVANRHQIAWEIVNGVRPMVTAADVLDKRPHVADECFANADFCLQVKDSDGWQTVSSTKIKKIVYFENGDKPSFKGTLFVEFWEDESLKDCWLEWADNDDVLDMEQLGLRPSVSKAVPLGPNNSSPFTARHTMPNNQTLADLRKIDDPTRDVVLGALIAAFDRIETAAPPCVTPEETDEHADNYCWGVCDMFSAIIQTYSADEIFLTDINGWLDEKIKTFLKARKENSEAPLPDLAMYAVEFIREFQYKRGSGHLQWSPPPVWTVEDTHATYKHGGWSVFWNDDGTYTLQALDDPEEAWSAAHGDNPPAEYNGRRFKSDAEAAAFVQEAANEGDALCRKAIEFLIGHNSMSVKAYNLHRTWEAGDH